MVARGSDSHSEGKVALSRLVGYLDDLLESDRFEDYGPNGLQVDGRASIGTIVTGVSACNRLFDLAVKTGADSVLVHHGLFWNNLPRPLTGIPYQRIARLVRSDISLLAYHLPLDAHPEFGNNVLAANGLGRRGCRICR